MSNEKETILYWIINNKANIQINKLGQRQSQTSFSSAFWIQMDFEYKKLLTCLIKPIQT